MSSTPNLLINRFIEGVLAHVTLNDAMMVLDVFAILNILDRDLTGPPGGESEGDAYIVAATATGDWDGEDGNVAYFNGGGWSFVPPKEGMKAWIADEDLLLVYDGSAWIRPPLAMQELSSDPADPPAGSSIIWQSDGTGSGDDGDIMVKITDNGGTTKTTTLVDFSAI